jgi:hypothetical protein
VLVPEPSEHAPSTPTARTAGKNTNAITAARGRTSAGPGTGTSTGTCTSTSTSTSAYTGVATKADEAASTWSILETITERRLEHGAAALLDRCDVSRDRAHRRCTSAADLRAGSARRCALQPLPDEPPF